MKDYRLSEIKKICQTHGCNDCPIYDDCWGNFGGLFPFMPAKWDIDGEENNEDENPNVQLGKYENK